MADDDVDDDRGNQEGIFRTHYGTIGDDREEDRDDEDEENQDLQYRDLEVNLEV